MISGVIVKFMVPIIVLGIILILIFALLKSRAPLSVGRKGAVEGWSYRKQASLLSLAEKAFYDVLVDSVDDKLIFAKVRVLDLVMLPEKGAVKACGFCGV